MSFLNRVGIGANKASAVKPARPSPTSPAATGFAPDPAAYGAGPGAGGAGAGAVAGAASAGPRALTPCGPSGKPLYVCNPFAKAALVKGSFRTIVSLPRYCDVNEWVAVNLVDFFNNLNLFLSVTSECCTTSSCPTMSAGLGMDYTWSSTLPNGSKKQVKVPAPQYIDYVMTWAEKLLADEATFPTKAGREFNAASFPSCARHLYTQFLRIFAHMYHAHFDHFIHLSSEGHLNSLFAHFLQFGIEFDLIEVKTRAPKEGVPFVVGDLIDCWRGMGILSAPAHS